MLARQTDDQGQKQRPRRRQPAEDVFLRHDVSGGVGHGGSHTIPAAPLVVGQSRVGQQSSVEHREGILKTAGEEGEDQDQQQHELHLLPEHHGVLI